MAPLTFLVSPTEGEIYGYFVQEGFDSRRAVRLAQVQGAAQEERVIHRRREVGVVGLARSRRVSVLGIGERGLERDSDHPPEPWLVRVRRVALRAEQLVVGRSVPMLR